MPSPSKRRARRDRRGTRSDAEESVEREAREEREVEEGLKGPKRRSGERGTGRQAGGRESGKREPQPAGPAHCPSPGPVTWARHLGPAIGPSRGPSGDPKRPCRPPLGEIHRFLPHRHTPTPIREWNLTQTTRPARIPVTPKGDTPVETTVRPRHLIYRPIGPPRFLSSTELDRFSRSAALQRAPRSRGRSRSDFQGPPPPSPQSVHRSSRSLPCLPLSQ